MKQRFLILSLLVIVTMAVTPAFAEQALVAVAANFVPPFREIAMEFEKSTGHQLQVAGGSSGNFYSQIKNGAPFDVFFSADMERPKKLEDEGLGVKDSRFTYAIGRLVLWSPNESLIKGEETLRSKQYKKLAMANPKTAPYGVAAMQALQRLEVWDSVQPHIVMGESLGQTMGFIESGNAQLGFVALSQVLDPKIKGQGSRWDVPNNLHEPIQQDVILLTKGKDNVAAKALLEFIGSPRAKAIIEHYGYELK
ncbi:molybdate ABC transporter substrate-binding protein [Candidatus Nitrospira nitrificans]|uniref:Molybdate-binding periplasmic protein n=1 Tax=Candidatus Nitrospira nitrificans TaxID=1742973 RepID=A0A0S4L7B6_9BACT|nr:molybdate ABC transporter substrate-binding protein [Candidatus Nitrospira nitrificans]CUS33591.1 Molybdate-binding periplasmic protein [Candidatus Nitrospira nitrificans]